MAVRVGHHPHARSDRQTHRDVAPRDLRGAHLPRRTPACRARPGISASIGCIGYLRSDGARPSWTFKQGNGAMKLRIHMRAVVQLDGAHHVLRARRPGNPAELDLLVRRLPRRRQAGGSPARILLRGPPLSVVYPRATQHLAKVRVFAEFAADLLRNYEARLRHATNAPGRVDNPRTGSGEHREPARATAAS